jgi:hypothetical protein
MRPQEPKRDTTFRVGVLLDSFIVPLWIRAVVEQICQSRLASIALVVKNAAAANGTPDSTVKHRVAYALYRSYCRFEDAYFTLDKDAYSNSDIAGFFANCDVVGTAPVSNGEYDDFDKATIERIASYRLDLILKFGFRRIQGDILRVARFGIWEHVHYDTQSLSGGPTGFWEVFRQMPFTGAALKVLGERPDLDRTIEGCLGYTEKKSVRRNRSNNAWRSSRFVMRCLERIQELGPGAIAASSSSGSDVPNRPISSGIPGNRQMSLLLAGHLTRHLKSVFDEKLYLWQWSVAFKLASQTEEIGISKEGLSVLQPPRDRFWADPFVLKQQEKYFIFVEELFYSSPKGHISVLEINPSNKMSVTNSTKVLEEKYHLSYPFVFCYRGAIYMLPETSENRTIQIYRAVNFPYKWELHAVLMEDVSAVDTTLAEGQYGWWMFTTMGVDSVPKVDELFLFRAETPFGPWKPHPKNPIVADCRRGRQAGRIFSYRGQLYRPAQCSTERGGYAVAINRILTLDESDYQEEPVGVIFPENFHGAHGHHTVNGDEGMTVIDILLKRRKWLRTNAAKMS